MRDHHARAPSFTDLRRPYKTGAQTARTGSGPGPGFPVYPDLVERLSANRAQPDPDGVIPHALATCAAYAYAGTAEEADPATLAMIMARLGMEENRCRVFEQRVSAMYVASAAYLLQDKDRRVVILCYRGTQPEDIISILTDADVRPETLRVDLGGERHDVHAGFYRNMRASRHLVMQALERALRGESVDPGEQGTVGEGMEALYITGHSLGGAMAALMGVVLIHEPRYADVAERLRAVYTFGQPMLGGPELARACHEARDPRGVHVLRDRLIRYIYDRDVVPALPPRPVGPYAPFGREFHYRRRRGVVDGTLALAADAVAEGLALPGDLLGGRLRATAGRRAKAVGRALGELTRGAGRESGWVEVREPAPLYPQMDSLAGLAVVAPLAFFAARLALTRNVPFTYSFEDHGPGHYVNALTPPGVMSEYGDVR